MQTKMYPLEILYCLKQNLKCEWQKNVKKTTLLITVFYLSPLTWLLLFGGFTKTKLAPVAQTSFIFPPESLSLIDFLHTKFSSPFHQIKFFM